MRKTATQRRRDAESRVGWAMCVGSGLLMALWIAGAVYLDMVTQ